MRVRITVEAAHGDFEVSLDRAELNKHAWTITKDHIDEAVDEAVARIKRAYQAPAALSDPEEQ